MDRSLNTFLLLPLVFIGLGNGHFTNLLILAFNFFFSSNNKTNENDQQQQHSQLFSLDFTKPLHVVVTLTTSVIFTIIGYYAACRHIEKRFYDSEASRNESEKWKCQPYSWLTEEQRRLQIVWGCFNAGVGSVMGVSIFIYQQLPSTSPGTVKIYYDLQDPLYAKFWRTDLLGGWPTYIVTTVLYFLLCDLWAYISHRILHWPLVYKYVHKFHHTFKAVSPFGAYALAIPEFVFITIGFQGIVFFMPIHFSSLAINLLYLGYHAIIDHSGIDFDGWFSFSPSTMYHDNHHLLFHCNFGQSLVFWDWLGGTLRRDGKKYGVMNFHD